MLLAASAAMMTCAPAFAAETVTYSYDALGRLVKSEHAGSVNHSVKEEVTYDAAGNRTNVTVSGQRVIVVPLKGLFMISLGSGS